MKLYELLTSWSLRARVLTVSAVLSTLVCVLSAYFAMKSYTQEKQTHIFEAHSLRTTAAAAKLRAFLFGVPLNDIVGNSARERLDLSSQKMPFPRPPQRGEVFTWRSQNPNVLNVTWPIEGSGSGPDGGNVEDDFEEYYALGSVDQGMFLRTIEDLGEIPLAIMDSAGEPLMTKDLQREQIELVAKQSRLSGLATVQSTIVINGKLFVFCFQEIPQTNLSILTLQSLEDFLLPLHKALKIWAAICGACLLVALGIQSVLISRLSEPLNALIRFFKAVSLGGSPVFAGSPLPELRPVFQGALVMRASIESREKRLRYFALGLEDIIKQGAFDANQTDEKTMVVGFVKTLMQILPTAHVFDPHFLAVESGTHWMWEQGGWKTASRPTDEKRSSLFYSIENSMEKNYEENFLKVFQREQLSLPENDENFEIFPKLEEKGDRTLKDGIICFNLVAGSSESARIIVPFTIPVPFENYNEFCDLLKVAADYLQKNFVNMSLTKQAISDEVLKNEVILAQSIQEKCIVIASDVPPSIAISSAFVPANRVGGDWMGVFSHKEHSFVHFYLGDVTGHGLDSAFLVSVLSGAVRMAERGIGQGLHTSGDNQDEFCRTYLEDMYKHLNEIFSSSTDGKFMTMVGGMLDANSGDLYFWNAGHLAPLRFQSSGAFKETLLSRQAEPLGAWLPGNQNARVAKVRLNPGETVLLFTDGLAENRGNGSFHLRNKKDLRHVGKILGTCSGEKFPGFATALLNWSKEHPDGWEMHDDVAILALRYG